MIWTAILKFFLANWKWLLGGFVLVVLYVKADNWLEDYIAERQAKEQMIMKLIQERDKAVIEAATAKAAMQEKDAHAERLELLLADALERQDQIRTEAREERRTFEEHDFGRLVDAKPGLIERLANKATAERMERFEDAFNNR